MRHNRIEVSTKLVRGKVSVRPAKGLSGNRAR